VEYTKALLGEIGLEPERLEMFHIGASDAPAWVRAVTEMASRARNLGPNPLRKGTVEDSRVQSHLPLDNCLQE
jgi:F420-non-reducing hydrogenase iron-sulfur subunit